MTDGGKAPSRSTISSITKAALRRVSPVFAILGVYLHIEKVVAGATSQE